jgi:hypothetical protein
MRDALMGAAMERLRRAMAAFGTRHGIRLAHTLQLPEKDWPPHTYALKILCEEIDRLDAELRELKNHSTEKKGHETKARDAVARVVDGLGTWKCHACGVERENQFISVAHRKVEMPRPPGSVVQLNARYCNDRPECLRRVPDVLDEWAAPLMREKQEGALDRDGPSGP